MHVALLVSLIVVDGASCHYLIIYVHAGIILPAGVNFLCCNHSCSNYILVNVCLLNNLHWLMSLWICDH